MGIPGVVNPLLAAAVAAAAPATGETIERSVRLNEPDGAYFTRTPSGAGNRKTWTISFWLKNCDVVNDQGILGAWLDINNRDNIFFGGGGGIQQFFLNMKTSSSWHVDKSTNKQWRDPSAWQHILWHWNTPHATATERSKVYFNGELVTWGGGYGVTDPGQNDDSIWNAACAHYIGAMTDNNGALDSNYLNGYISNFHFVDGLALEPSDFTTTNSTTGQLVPIEYTGSYGTNGFHLEFADNSGATATTLGKDTSGNSNNWTPTNIQIAATEYSASSRFSAHSGASQYLTNVNANMFDSSENTYVSYANGNQPNSGFTWSASGLSLSGALTVKTYGDGGNPSTITVVHGGGTATVTNTGGSVWSTMGTLSGIVSIDVNRHDQGICHGIKIDGVLITNGNAYDVDSVRDSPTNGDPDDETGAGGIVPGNYCTWNPVDWQDLSKIQLSNGNLTTYRTDGGWYSGRGTFAMTSGKWYFECTAGTNFSAAINYNVGQIGITKDKFNGELGIGGTAGDSYMYYNHNGDKMDGNAGSGYGNTWSSGDVIGVAYDADNGKIWFAKNNTWQASGNPSTGANPAFSSISGIYYPGICQYSNVSASYLHTNFGQLPFAYSVPTGFKPLATPFLPDPAIAKANEHFDIATYTGTGNSLAITGLVFQPDFLWFKSRSNAAEHHLQDALRGVTKMLQSDTNAAEITDSNLLTSFDSSGFTLPADSSGESNNVSGWTWVSWAWKAATTASGTWGANSKAYSRRTNATAGFSIIKYVGDASNGIPGTGAIPHGLSGAPDLYIQKRLDSTGDWWTAFTAFDGSFDYMKLNDTASKADDTNTLWDTDEISNWGGGNDQDFIGYVFKSIPGYSKIGTYVGNANADGPCAMTEFRPKLVIIKAVSWSNSYTNWDMNDTARDPYNVMDNTLVANRDDAENSGNIGTQKIDFLANGFKVRQEATSSSKNTSGVTYLYIAFAEAPFKYSRAR